ncbi:MAG TPA: hypothetical protein VN626_01000, partial [Clostridia bacterium]|nr:hypothetical protein [Clostridia bacterium]
MKRLEKRFTTLCLVAAATLSLIIGAGLPRIQVFSSNVVSRLFPVEYQITYRNAVAQPIFAPVHFITDTAILTTSEGDTTVLVSDAVFVCMQNELRIQNTLRSGLLSAFLVLVSACLPSAFAATAYYHGMCKFRHKT